MMKRSSVQKNQLSFAVLFLLLLSGSPLCASGFFSHLWDSFWGVPSEKVEVHEESLDQSEKRPREKRDVSEFNKITITGPGELFVAQGNKEALEIEADETVLPHIIGDVEESTLRLLIDPRAGLPEDTFVKYIVSIKDITKITIMGGVSFTSKKLKADDFDLFLATGDTVDVGVDVKNLSVIIHGSGHVDISGTAQEQKVSIVGAGVYAGNNLVSNGAVLDLAGSGKAEINAGKKITGSVFGSVTLLYAGNPDVSELKKTGIVTVAQR